MTKEELRKSLDFVCEERERLYNEKVDLQKRIDKAIEYIDRRDIEWDSEEHDILLNILRGEDK